MYSEVEVNENKMKHMNNNIKVKLNDQEMQNIEGCLTEYECSTALKEMKNNKSPGSDGITTEFYKMFWKEIKMFYVSSLNFSFHNGNLTTLQKQGITSLLPPKDKDLCNINNWRPLTFLNTDYKIATKAIANRIKKHLPKIIDSSQTGLVKDRYIGENIRLIEETIEALENENSPGLLFFADSEKTFDSVNHKFILNCLECFNFGSDIIKWVKCFYNQTNSCVLNAGKMTDFLTYIVVSVKAAHCLDIIFLFYILKSCLQRY